MTHGDTDAEEKATRTQRQRSERCLREPRKEGEARKGSVPAPLEGAGPCRHLDLGLRVSGTVRDCAPVIEGARFVVIRYNGPRTRP